MNLVDSSAWLEYFANGPNAAFFAPPIENTPRLVVATLNLFEVFKRIVPQRGEGAALKAVAHMQQARVMDLDSTLALAAAQLSLQLKLPLADSVILASARACHATLWTQDEHFARLPGVKYVMRKP